MQWADTAYVLSTRKFGESGAVATVFARSNGLCSGVVRAATSKTQRGIWQPGNEVEVRWQARLAEQLGSFNAELLTAHAAHLMADSAKLSALSSACSLLVLSLAERHPYPQLYTHFSQFIGALQQGRHWPEHYVMLELALLAEAGFGLDLSRCAATGTQEDLVYVSPKSGRAVSRFAGSPYHDKLLPLPNFIRSGQAAEKKDILNGLSLTEYFLEHWLLAPHQRKIPPARHRYLQLLKAHHP